MLCRRLLPAALVLLVLPASATAATGGATAPPAGTGGVEYGQLQHAKPAAAKPARLQATLTASAATLGGAPARFAYRVNGRPTRVRVRIDVLGADGGLVERLKLGVRRTGRDYTAAWTPADGAVAAGTYVARLVASDSRRRARAARSASLRATVLVNPKPVVIPPGTFPVQGSYSFGGDGSRFGAARAGHIHQGQDLTAAEGTPLVSPKAGYVYWKAYQAGGAGHYVVIRGDDGRDYVFMHMREASPLAKGDRVAAGGVLGYVGNTGSSSGAHLHFEIWPAGWYAKDSVPIDPLPELKAWAGIA